MAPKSLCRGGFTATKYLIDEILPAHRLHLTAGLSNAGKTRFLLPMFLQWEKGLPILGRASHPVPWCYVVADRLLIEAEDTLSAMGIDPYSIRMIGAFGPDNKNFCQIMRAIGSLNPLPQFAVVESLGDMVDGMGRRREVRDLCSRIAAHCQPGPGFPEGLTMMGVMETPKQVVKDKYPDPRQLVSGAAGWGYHSSSVFLIEGEDFAATKRTLSVSIKNGPSFKVNGGFSPEGRLEFNHLSPADQKPLLINMQFRERL